MNAKNYFFLFLLFHLISCTAPKFVFEHEGLSQLDFENGKWILNNLTSNKPAHDLNEHSFEKWSEIIKDSLYSLNDLRVNHLIAETIDFDINYDTLKSLKRNSWHW